MVDGTVEGHESYEDAVAAQPAEALPDRVDGVDMLYSSGTTGLPKGIETPLPGVDARRRDPGRHARQDALRLRRGQGVPEPGAACTTPPRCASASASTSSAAPSS